METSQPAVIPSHDTLIGDLLSMDLNPPIIQNANQPAAGYGGHVDLLGGGLDALVRMNELHKLHWPVQSGL